MQYRLLSPRMQHFPEGWGTVLGCVHPGAALLGIVALQCLVVSTRGQRCQMGHSTSSIHRGHCWGIGVCSTGEQQCQQGAVQVVSTMGQHCQTIEGCSTGFCPSGSSTARHRRLQYWVASTRGQQCPVVKVGEGGGGAGGQSRVASTMV